MQHRPRLVQRSQVQVKSFSAKKVVVQHVKEHVESSYQRHGGVAHGPKPRDYSQKTNRKMRQLAMQRALFDRAVSGGLSVIEDLAVEAPKTKIFNNVLKNVYPERCKC